MRAVAEEFQLVAGHVALDFANTLDNRYDAARLTELLPSYERFLAFAAQSGTITATEAARLLRRTSPGARTRALRKAIEMREALYLLLLAAARRRRPPRPCLQTLNGFLAKTRTPAALIRTRNGFAWRRDAAASAAGPLTLIVEAAAELLASPDCAAVHECGAPSCRWLFLDRSKNHTRRWCDMRICGNREKARRFQSRRA